MGTNGTYTTYECSPKVAFEPQVLDLVRRQWPSAVNHYNYGRYTMTLPTPSSGLEPYWQSIARVASMADVAELLLDGPSQEELPALRFAIAAAHCGIAANCALSSDQSAALDALMKPLDVEPCLRIHGMAPSKEEAQSFSATGAQRAQQTAGIDAVKLAPEQAICAVQSHYCCFHCGKIAASMTLCSGCNHAAFCGRECQRAAWKAHKPLCQELKAELEQRPKTLKKTTFCYHSFLHNVLQMANPMLARFWLAALVNSLCTDNDSNAMGQTIALQSVTAFLFHYTSRAMPPHLLARLRSDLRMEQRTLQAHESTLYVFFTLLLHREACFEARAAGCEPPGPPAVQTREGTADNMARFIAGFLVLGQFNDDVRIAQGPPDFTVGAAAMYNAPRLRMNTCVRGLGLVTSAAGPRFAPKLCADLLAQWRTAAFWRERPLADVPTDVCIQPGASDKRGKFKGGPWCERITQSERGRSELRAALRRVPRSGALKECTLLAYCAVLLPPEFKDYLAAKIDARIKSGDKRKMSAAEAEAMSALGGVYAKLAVKAARGDELAEAIQSFHTIAMEVKEDTQTAVAGAGQAGSRQRQRK